MYMQLVVVCCRIGTYSTNDLVASVHPQIIIIITVIIVMIQVN